LARLLPPKRSARAVLGVLSPEDPNPRLPDTRDGGRDLAISLARDPAVIAFARELVKRVPRHDHLGRVSAVFTFVSHLVDGPPSLNEDPRDGVDVLVALAGDALGPAVILSALLRALGEQAPLRRVGGLSFVAVELQEGDLTRLPPHAVLLQARGRSFIPLDPRCSRAPFGFLPRGVRDLFCKGGRRRLRA
jgi:hypothetical protein